MSELTEENLVEGSLAEFIWERCEMDIHKTNEIIEKIIEMLPPEEDDRPEITEWLVSKDYTRGRNQFRSEFIEKLKEMK